MLVFSLVTVILPLAGLVSGKPLLRPHDSSASLASDLTQRALHYQDMILTKITLKSTYDLQSTINCKDPIISLLENHLKYMQFTSWIQTPTAQVQIAPPVGIHPHHHQLDQVKLTYDAAFPWTKPSDFILDPTLVPRISLSSYLTSINLIGATLVVPILSNSILTISLRDFPPPWNFPNFFAEPVVNLFCDNRYGLLDCHQATSDCEVKALINAIAD